MPNFSPCELHIPHKDWARDVGASEVATSKERENYSEIERWARYFYQNCVASGCNCGDTLAVNFDNKTTSSTFFVFDTSGFVDIDGYGYDGGTSLSWDDAAHEVRVLSNGLYSCNALVEYTAFGTTPGGAVRVQMQRIDRFDNWLFCNDNDSNVANIPGGEIFLNPQLAAYPFPAGATLQWQGDQNTGGSITAHLVFVMTKVNCCTLPPGPPIC